MKKDYRITAHIYENGKYVYTSTYYVEAPNPYSARIKAEKAYKDRGYIPGHSVYVVEVEEMRN